MEAEHNANFTKTMNMQIAWVNIHNALNCQYAYEEVRCTNQTVLLNCLFLQRNKKELIDFSSLSQDILISCEFLKKKV